MMTIRWPAGRAHCVERLVMFYIAEDDSAVVKDVLPRSRAQHPCLGRLDQKATFLYQGQLELGRHPGLLE